MGERSVKVAMLAVGYCITGALGLSLALPPGYATAVWPPSGSGKNQCAAKFA